MSNEVIEKLDGKISYITSKPEIKAVKRELRLDVKDNIEFEEFMLAALKKELGLYCTSFAEIEKCERMEEKLKELEPDEVDKILEKCVRDYIKRKKKKKMMKVCES